MQQQPPATAPNTDRNRATTEDGEQPEDDGAGDTDRVSNASTAESGDSTTNGLTEDEKAEVAELKSEDTRVRNHEAAHASAGGAHAGSPQFSFTTGPDGKRYATSGSVPIDVAPVPGDPKATIQKMDQVKRAALAPADPSGADRSVAAQADKTKQQAQREQRELRAEETEPQAPEKTAEKTPGQPAGKTIPVGPEADSASNRQPGAISSPQFEHRLQPDTRNGGEVRGLVQNSTFGRNHGEPQGFAALTEIADNTSSVPGSGSTQQKASFAQAIDAYQRAGNASAAPRISSLQ